MTKLFLAAGVAALAITAPAAAAPGDRDAKQNRAERTKAVRSDRQAARVQRERPQRAERQAARQAQRVERPQRAERQAVRQAQRVERPQRVERQAVRQAQRVERPQRVEARPARVATVDNRQAARAQRVENRMAERQMKVANRMAERELRTENRIERQMANAERRAFNQAVRTAAPIYSAERVAALRTARVADLNTRYGYSFAAPTTAASLLGLPLTQANAILPLGAVPGPISYLYPSTAMYDYRYNDGYIYQVDKTSSLIAALIPLLAGGYLPGQVLPQSYMNSYVPNYYGYNSFYPNYQNSYGFQAGYQNGYQNQCTRYANGIVYYVDCYTGMIENVVPLYDRGYGVGQMLPSSYGYYNVPDQYRPYYYNTANTGYWYAPGAIYQYDPQTSLITSVAALLSPGLTVGQPLPVGYGAYNVPLGFRDQYYDSPNAMYRYANGNIYQIDPVTQLVTALVASALT